MAHARANLWAALCASCAVHGVALAALERNAHHGDAAVQDRASRALNVVLGGVPPAPTKRVRARADAGDVSPFSGTAVAGGAADGKLPVPPEPHFLGMDELDTVPEARSEIELPPPLLGTLSESAHAVLVLFVNSAGLVERVELEASTLPAGYAETTMSAFRTAVFKPGERGGRPVNSRIRIDISVE